MNFCTKCYSYYTVPGTCNCYAVKHVTYPGTGTNQSYCGLCGRPYFVPEGSSIMPCQCREGTTTIRVDVGDDIWLPGNVGRPTTSDPLAPFTISGCGD